MNKYFRLAKKTALKGGGRRQHRLGAVGIRYDGALVKARNLANIHPEPHAHAEARIVKKMGRGGVIYVVRILRNGSYALARPCLKCQQLMINHDIRRCYYSISDNEYGVLVLGDK